MHTRRDMASDRRTQGERKVERDKGRDFQGGGGAGVDYLPVSS